MIKTDKSNEAWKELFNKYDIVKNVKEKGYFKIKASQIKEFREPRLMAKWDSYDSLPSILKDKNINILPITRGSYILSDFKLYQSVKNSFTTSTKMHKVKIPKLESVDVRNITSESNAINVLLLSNILDKFLNEDGNVSTFNGRMGTGKFKFNVDRKNRGPLEVEVDKAQCEIDGGMENKNSVVIMEAKNVVNNDFHIRRLYYPYRLWRERVNKPIRLVFSVYSNQIYRLQEYVFTDINNYSSIQLVKENYYSLEDTEISIGEIFEIYKSTKVETDDNMISNSKDSTPFIQADSFERVISLLEVLYKEDLTTEEIAGVMEFKTRQSDYYYNAGKYLGIFEKYIDTEDTDAEGKNLKKVRLTKLGKIIVKKSYKDRQLALVKLMFKHKIFSELFFELYSTGKIPIKDSIQEKMRKYNVCSERVIDRRSSSVVGWLSWICSLTNIEEI